MVWYYPMMRFRRHSVKTSVKQAHRWPAQAITALQAEKWRTEGRGPSYFPGKTAMVPSSIHETSYVRNSLPISALWAS